MPHLTRRWPLYALIACALGLAFSLLALVTNPRTSAVIPAAIATPAPPTFITAAPTTVAATETSTVAVATSTPRSAFAFGTFGDIDTIVINERQVSMGGTIEKQSALGRVGDQFTGHVTFRVSYYTYKGEGNITRAVSVPAAVVQRFLQSLQDLLLPTPTPIPTPTPKTPVPTPSEIQHGFEGMIRLQSGPKSVQFLPDTRNLTIYTIPYNSSFNIQGQHLDYNILEQAITILKPYLRDDVLSSIYNNQTPAP